MAEFNEESLSGKMMDCQLEEGKKKKCRVKPGRHKKEKRRVAQRDRMNMEKEARRDSERKLMKQVDEQRIQCIGSIKDVTNRSFAAFWALEVTTTVLPEPKMPQNEAKNLEQLSRHLVKLLRWELPSSGIPYNQNDGSVNVVHLAQHFQVTQSALIKATSSDVGKGKRRLITFEEKVNGTNRTERRVAALGGHGFHVPYPQGHILIDKDDSEIFSPLIHETDARDKIEESGVLSAMKREGGINFTSKQRGGYRSKANVLVTLDAQQLKSAIESGLTFFHNQFSGLVFGVGRKTENGNWDLEIPTKFLTISSV